MRSGRTQDGRAGHSHIDAHTHTQTHAHSHARRTFIACALPRNPQVRTKINALSDSWTREQKDHCLQVKTT